MKPMMKILLLHNVRLYGRCGHSTAHGTNQPVFVDKDLLEDSSYIYILSMALFAIISRVKELLVVVIDYMDLNIFSIVSSEKVYIQNHNNLINTII